MEEEQQDIPQALPVGALSAWAGYCAAQCSTEHAGGILYTRLSVPQFGESAIRIAEAVTIDPIAAGNRQCNRYWEKFKSKSGTSEPLVSVIWSEHHDQWCLFCHLQQTALLAALSIACW